MTTTEFLILLYGSLLVVALAGVIEQKMPRTHQALVNAFQQIRRPIAWATRPLLERFNL